MNDVSRLVLIWGIPGCFGLLLFFFYYVIGRQEHRFRELDGRAARLLKDLRENYEKELEGNRQTLADLRLKLAELEKGLSSKSEKEAALQNRLIELESQKRAWEQTLNSLERIIESAT